MPDLRPGSGIPPEYTAKVEAARAAGSMQGERRLVTILFCDVTGSTTMAERLDPEEWAEIMDDAFDFFITPVYRYEGTVARLMGDAILAFFGAPIAHENDPERAVLAALDIVDGIQPFREKIQREYGLEFNVRVGINTGMVVVGDIGSDKAMEYTAMGDAVNLASRMEQTAQPGDVQVSEHTYKLVAPLFDFEPLGEIEVKGKSEPVQAYRVLGRKPEPGRLRGMAGLESPLIGREREMEALRKALDDLGQGRGGIVALIGEAGLGKSRIIEELKTLTKDEGRTTEELSSSVLRPSSFAVLESHGISYDTQRAYGLFRQQIRQTCGVSVNDPPEVARQKILQSMMDTSLHRQSAEIDRFKDLTEVLLSVETDPTALQHNGEAFKRELYEVIPGIYRHLAEQSPLLMILDDLHWADPASIELVLHLFQLVDEIPILFLCAFRPYRQSPGWQVKTQAETDYPHRYLEINLSPLSKADSDMLVSNLLKVSALPEKLRGLILHKSEGNPFFMEEVVRTLIDQGVVARDETGLRWEAAADVEEVHLPDTLQALLIARIDRLDADVRRTLQLAAVIGRQFPYPVLKYVSEANGSLDRHLNTLQRAELVMEISRLPELEYRFRHELTRDAAYETILHRKRRVFHRKVGEAIEALFPERLGEEAHQLAYHFMQARDYERALKYNTMAGDAAMRLYANAEAAVLYARALEIARRIGLHEQLNYLYSRRGRALELSGEYDAALENYRELEVFGRERGDQALELAGLLPQATIYSTPTARQDLEQGRVLAERGLALARQLGDVRAEVRGLWNMMLLHIFSGKDANKGVAYGEQALMLSRQHELQEEMAYILNDIPRAYVSAGRMADARAALEQAIGIWRQLNNLPMLADGMGTLGQGLYLSGELDQALEVLQEGLRISREVGSLWGQAFNLMTLGPVYLELGDIDRGVQALLDSIPLAEQANFTAPQTYVQVLLAWVYLTLGDMEGAEAIFQSYQAREERMAFFSVYESVWQILKDFYTGNIFGANQGLQEIEGQIQDVSNLSNYGGLIMSFAGQVAMADGQPERALEIAEKTIAGLKASGIRLFLPDLLHLQGQALIQLGRAAEGHPLLLEALAEARAQSSRRNLWQILATLIQLENGRGEAALAEEHRREWQETVDTIASQIRDPKLRRAFLSLPAMRELAEGASHN